MLTLKGFLRQRFKISVVICFYIACLLVFHPTFLMAFDEDMFYEYAVYSTIYMHEAEEAGQMELQPYLHDMKSRFPEFMSDEWKNYGEEIARDPASDTIGRNYAWRTYFNGRAADEAPPWRPTPKDHVQETNLSAVFLSQATHRWIVTLSAPVSAVDDAERFLGVVAVTG